MIGLDFHRNIIRDMGDIEKDLSKKEFLVIDNYDEIKITGDLVNNHHFEPYSSNNLVYLREKDLVYSIHDLDKGLLLRAPYKKRRGYIQSWVTPCIEFQIPKLKKILKNIKITKSTASKKIKERDNYCCQLCGESDKRVLNVHHIIPRISPFADKQFIESPINQITLCANCHRIEHYVLEHGSKSERKEHVEMMFEKNGYKVKDDLGRSTLHDTSYESMNVLKKYK